jgi:hypothetical protein
MNSLYTIIFDNNTRYTGGSLDKTLWSNIPNDKNIRSIFYSLPTGDMIALSGYNRYYQMIEVTQDIYGSPIKEKVYRYCYLFGQRDNDVICYKISLQKGLIDILKYDVNDEYIKKLNPIFWKKGR